MIRLQNICKTYRTKHQKIQALKNISLTLPNRGMVFITGKSGCGKTTLLNVLGGLDAFDSGDFFLNGVSLKHYREADWNRYRNTLIGYVFQENNLFDEFNVFENVSLALDLQKIRDKQETVENALRVVGLEKYSNRRISELSGGQRQRVAIARAIAKHSSILLADEPTGSLDSVTGKEIFTLLKEISAKQLVVVVSHDLSSAEEYGDCIIEISDGEIVRRTGEPMVQDLAEPSEVLQHLRSGAISFGRKLKMAMTSFLHKPFRFLVLLFLCTFGFSLMAGALKFCNWDPYSTQERLLKGRNVVYIKQVDIPVEDDESDPRRFTESKIDEFQKKYPSLQIIRQYDGTKAGTSFLRFYERVSERQSTYFRHIEYPTYMNQATMEQLGFELVAGEYPSENWGPNDIAITKYFFEMYQLCGALQYTRVSDPDLGSYGISTKVEIERYTDLLNVDFGEGVVIRGIIDTHYDLDMFAPVKAYALGQSDKLELEYEESNHWFSYQKYGFENTIFCGPQSQLVTNQGLYNIAVLYDEEDFRESGIIYDVLDGDEYRFADYESETLYYHSLNHEDFGNTMLKVSLAMIVFAVLLFANFIMVSISDKSRQIGILCALGTGKDSILSVFVIQNVVTGLCIFVASFFAVREAVLPFLRLMADSGSPSLTSVWFVMEPLDYVGILAVIVGTAVLSSVLPFATFIRKSPRKIIYGK